MSGGRDGGVSFAPFVDELPPPPPEPFEPDPEPVFEPEPEVRAQSPYMDDAKAEVGVESTSSDERRERRRSRRASGAVDERPRTRRITVTEKDRPAGRRIESDRPRTRGHDEERPRPRRGETERRSSGRTSKKKEESGGLKSLFGGLKKRITWLNNGVWKGYKLGRFFIEQAFVLGGRFIPLVFLSIDDWWFAVRRSFCIGMLYFSFCIFSFTSWRVIHDTKNLHNF
jgi:hypothetical protein